MKKWLRTLFAFFVFILLTTFTGCQKVVTYNGDASGTTCANITMRSGKFAYSNGFIYFSYFGTFYEYDIESGKVIQFDIGSSARSLFAAGEYIYYIADGLQCTRKDGKKQFSIYDLGGKGAQFFADGMDAYYLDGIEGSLYHRDLQTNAETTLISDVLAYCVDANTVYAIARKDDGVPALFESSRDTLAFEQVSLSFSPITVYANGDSLYLAERGSHQIIRCKDGEEERLPLFGLYYQVLDGSLVYMDSTTYASSCFTLKSEDLSTGETTVICEDVYDFCILEGRYICCETLPDRSDTFITQNDPVQFILYDSQTGQLAVMNCDTTV